MGTRSIPARPDDRAEHRRQSQELWQQMAGRWEQGRGVMWEITRPVSEWLVDHVRPQPGETLLDLAAGTGETGFLAARRLGADGRLICSDFAPNMVDAARRVASELGITNADFRVLDAERLDLQDDSVDAVVCRFGYMLMGDPAQAFGETRRVLRPGGGLAFAVFGEPGRNPWMTVTRGVMGERGHVAPPNPDEPGMFSLSDPQRITALLGATGFGDAEVEGLPLTFRFDDADALWAYTSELQGPIALAIAKLDDTERSRIRAALEEAYAPFRQDGGYAVPGLALVVAAG